ncbi:MAG: hypothetical protein KGP27_17510 [Hyphomicrobiales bacterium]|nr:hypothetical protein [Hyphomicrobiales bacterium]
MKTSQLCEILNAAARQHEAVGRVDIAKGLKALADALKPLQKLSVDDALKRLPQ